MKQVEIFRTNVQELSEAALILNQLQLYFPCFILNFDLEDCDRILRVESTNEFVLNAEICVLIKELGYSCEHFSN